jgi:hypothetical protein
MKAPGTPWPVQSATVANQPPRHRTHQLQAVAHAGEQAFAGDDETIGQGFFAVLHGFHGQRVYVGAGVHDQRLLVHEGDAALLAVQLHAERLAELGQEDAAVDQADGAVAFHHGQADQVAVAGEDLEHLLVGLVGRHAGHGSAQVRSAGWAETGPGIAQVGAGLIHGRHIAKLLGNVTFFLLQFCDVGGLGWHAHLLRITMRQKLRCGVAGRFLAWGFHPSKHRGETP